MTACSCPRLPHRAAATARRRRDRPAAAPADPLLGVAARRAAGPPGPARSPRSPSGPLMPVKVAARLRIIAAQPTPRRPPRRSAHFPVPRRRTPRPLARQCRRSTRRAHGHRPVDPRSVPSTRDLGTRPRRPARRSGHRPRRRRQPRRRPHPLTRRPPTRGSDSL